MKGLLALSAGVGGLAWWRSRGRTTRAGTTPGAEKAWDTRLLEAGATLLQSRSPVSAMSVYLNGFHFFADDMGRQVEAHHYCTQLNEDFMQCVIFDGNRRDARLIGVEYVISERLFADLPPEERRLWHSHRHEVTSGTLIAAGIPEPVERELMKKVIRTYGKVWHTWDTSEHALPVGIPRLMMAFTADGQLDEGLVAARDARFGVSTAERRRARADIPVPAAARGADEWESGRTHQLTLVERPFGHAAAERPAAAPAAADAAADAAAAPAEESLGSR